MVSPFGTIPALGARLAKLTFAPDIVLTDGEAALMVGAPPLNTRPAELVREAAMPYRTVFDVVWSGRRNMMMMASQIDRTGNQNISAIGPHDKPKVQLVGVRGAPGNSVNHPTSYWVPDHTVRTFVEQVDVVCGVGYVRAAAAGAGPHAFTTSLASSRTSVCSTSRRRTTPCACARIIRASPWTTSSAPPVLH